MTKEKQNKGITLVALVVTIIVLLILAGVSIGMFISENGIVKQATKTSIYTSLSEIKEQISLNQIDNTSDSKIYLNTDQVNKIISDSKYKSKIGVYRNNLYYLTDNNDSEISKSAKKLGFESINMTPDEFKYYIELGILQDKVQEKKNNPVGRELATNDYSNTITIGTNTYSNGWYLIGNYSDIEKTNGTYNSDYTDLELTDTSHAPYIVNYSNNVVLSIYGMTMYATEIEVHSFDVDVSALASSIVYADANAKRTEEYFGESYSTSLYNGSIWYTDNNQTAVYSDNDGKLQYDENKALMLDMDNAIPVLEINQKYKINDSYTISVTVDGKIDQSNNQSLGLKDFAATILAISGKASDYCSWIGFYKGFLHVHSFSNSNYSTKRDYEYKTKGFASIDISEYEGKIMNIQVVATRNKKTNVYINGKNVCEFDSGAGNTTYKYLTIGDLRVGRGLKFTGKVYDFILYGTALTEDQIQMNYKKSKAYVSE